MNGCRKEKTSLDLFQRLLPITSHRLCMAPLSIALVFTCVQFQSPLPLSRFPWAKSVQVARQLPEMPEVSAKLSLSDLNSLPKGDARERYSSDGALAKLPSQEVRPRVRLLRQSSEPALALLNSRKVHGRLSNTRHSTVIDEACQELFPAQLSLGSVGWDVVKEGNEPTTGFEEQRPAIILYKRIAQDPGGGEQDGHVAPERTPRAKALNDEFRKYPEVFKWYDVYPPYDPHKKWPKLRQWGEWVRGLLVVRFCPSCAGWPSGPKVSWWEPNRECKCHVVAGDPAIIPYYSDRSDSDYKKFVEGKGTVTVYEHHYHFREKGYYDCPEVVGEVLEECSCSMPLGIRERVLRTWRFKVTEANLSWFECRGEILGAKVDLDINARVISEKITVVTPDGSVDLASNTDGTTDVTAAGGEGSVGFQYHDPDWGIEPTHMIRDCEIRFRLGERSVCNDIVEVTVWQWHQYMKNRKE